MKTKFVKAFSLMMFFYFIIAMYGQIRVEHDYFKAFGSLLFAVVSLMYFRDAGKEKE
jgi:hypothetical protein